MEIYHETALEKAFHFTPDDLRENRQGQLSGAQIDRLRRRAGRTAWIILGILGALAVLTLVSANVTPGDVPLFAICLLVPALVTLALTIGLTEAAISPRVVAKRSGQIHLAAAPFGYEPPLDPIDMNNFPTRRFWVFGNSRARGPMGQYSMIIGDQQFRLTQEEFQALHPAVYTVYFIPTIQKIVSMELMSTTEAEIALPPISEPTLPLSPSSPFDDDQDIMRG